ncbi:hypothetical protein V9T40_001942 [Parthenolecanium corni]|uniref:Uncharacterized protein n=1 Tax=Parthenolecanium corni TaxID=536013 RepID=A0AAN9Y3N0_9HEMI
MAKQNLRTGFVQLPGMTFDERAMPGPSNQLTSTSTNDRLTDEDKDYIRNCFLPYIQELLNEGKKPVMTDREFSRFVNTATKSKEWKPSFSFLENHEKEHLQAWAESWLQNELVDDRDSLQAVRKTEVDSKEIINERRSLAALKRLYKYNFKELCYFWLSQEQQLKFVFFGEKSKIILDNFETRFDYFKTCLYRLRSNLKIFLHFNLVQQMPQRTTHSITNVKYRIQCIKYRSEKENLLKRSLDTPIEELLSQIDVQPLSSNLVYWPGDDKKIDEPVSSLREYFTTKKTTKDFQKKLIDIDDSFKGYNQATFHGQERVSLSTHHIISKQLLLKILERLQESNRASKYPHIDHRFDNVLDHNYRKYYIVNFWKNHTPGADPRSYAHRNPPTNFPQDGKIFNEGRHLNMFGRSIIWVEGNLFAGPLPEHRGPFDPSKWEESSFEQDAKPILGLERFTEMRILHDSMKRFVNLEQPTDSQKNEIQERWLDVFWRYHFRPVNVDQWIKRSPTDEELKRLKKCSAESRNKFEKKLYWAIKK